MHTPGPWTSGRAIPADDTVARIVRAGDDHIAVVMDLDGAAQEAVDNARLIAAAPDLLDALKRVMRHVPAGAGGASLGDDMYRARLAITRATGGK
jgi:hypothetical protein